MLAKMTKMFQRWLVWRELKEAKRNLALLKSIGDPRWAPYGPSELEQIAKNRKAAEPLIPFVEEEIRQLQKNYMSMAS